MSEQNQECDPYAPIDAWLSYIEKSLDSIKAGIDGVKNGVEGAKNAVVYLKQVKESGYSKPQSVSLSSEQEDTFVVTKPVEASESKKEECFYFQGVAKGTFSKPSPEPEEYSLYRFVKTDGGKALVYVENNPNAVKKFKNNPDAQESACEQENQCPDNPKGIQTLEPGEAVFDGNNKWTITSKVKIRYI